MATEKYIYRHNGPRDEEISFMLEKIGVSSVDELINQTAMRDLSHQLFAMFDDKNFKLNSADLTLSSSDFGVKVMKHSTDSNDYYYVLGYIKEKMVHELDNVLFQQELDNLQLQVNKLMLFF